MMSTSALACGDKEDLICFACSQCFVLDAFQLAHLSSEASNPPLSLATSWPTVIEAKGPLDFVSTKSSTIPFDYGIILLMSLAECYCRANMWLVNCEGRL
ncbi:unnamed protein product [Caretta caretta]